MFEVDTIESSTQSLGQKLELKFMKKKNLITKLWHENNHIEIPKFGIQKHFYSNSGSKM